MPLITLDKNEIKRLFNAWNKLFDIIAGDDPEELPSPLKEALEEMNNLLFTLLFEFFEDDLLCPPQNS